MLATYKQYYVVSIPSMSMALNLELLGMQSILMNYMHQVEFEVHGVALFSSNH